MRRQKFNARKIVVNGVEYSSTLEGNCIGLAQEYEKMPTANIIVELKPKFTLIPKQKLPSGKTEQDAVYTADCALHNKKRGIRVIVEIKSEATAKEPDYVLRRKLMYSVHKIEVIEIFSLNQMRRLCESLNLMF